MVPITRESVPHQGQENINTVAAINKIYRLIPVIMSMNLRILAIMNQTSFSYH
jgi:hypothetical protein